MPERKRFFFIDVFPYIECLCIRVSVSLPYLSWNIETSAVVDILFSIVFMQLKLKIEQLVCHWRVKMLQAQSVFTGERLTLLNSPHPLPFQTSWATQYFEHVLEAAIWDLNITSSKCVFTGTHLWTSAPLPCFQTWCPPFYELASILNMFWRQPFEICSW